MRPHGGSTPPDYAGLRGLGDLGGEVYVRWVRIAIVLVLVGYGVVTLSGLLVFRTQDRSLAFATQGTVLLTALGAFWLTARGRARLAAGITLVAVWLELHSSLPGSGLNASSLIVMPVLISAGGMLVGGAAGYWFAGLTALTIPAASLAGIASRGQPVVFDSEGVYLWVITTAAMFASAALVELGLESFSRVLAGAQASEGRMANLQRHAPDGMVATDRAGHVVSANPRAEELLGSGEGALVGRSLTSVLAEVCEDGVSLAEWVASPPEDGSSIQAIRMKTDGEPLLVEAQGTPVPWADGSVGLQLTLRDITDRERALANEHALRAQLEHSQRLEGLGRLAGGVAHEFNNVLTVVGGAAELILADAEGTEAELAAEIVAAKSRGAALIKQLLAFARRDLVQPRRLSLTGIVAGMEPLLSRFLSEGVVLELDLTTDTVAVVADQAQIEQVLINFVLNAKDALGDEGRIGVGVAPAGAPRAFLDRRWTVPPGSVELWVEDSGPGMDDQTLERIFEPFFTTKPRGKGTGLGLATVHGIVSQNGGTVEVLTELGRGSVFLVRWPVAMGG